jgi:hypothetical protein
MTKGLLWIRIRIGSGFNSFVDPDLDLAKNAGSILNQSCSTTLVLTRVLQTNLWLEFPLDT